MSRLRHLQARRSVERGYGIHTKLYGGPDERGLRAALRLHSRQTAPLVRRNGLWSTQSQNTKKRSVYYAHICSVVSHDPVHSALPSMLTPTHDTRLRCLLTVRTRSTFRVSHTHNS